MTMVDDEPTVSIDEADEAGPTGARPEDDGGGRGDDGEVSPFQRWRAHLPLIVIVLLAWMVAAGAVILWNQNRDLTADRDDRRGAARVAADFTTAVLGYDHRDLQGSVDDVLALSTPDWGREYEDAWFQEQQPIVEATRARAEVVVDDVLLGEAANGILPVVVTFNATIRSEVGVRRLTGSYIRVDLVDDGDGWRVDDMLYLASQNQDLEPGTGVGGGGNAGG